MDEKNPKKVHLMPKKFWALTSSFLKVSIEKKVSYFFCVHFTNQAVDFYGVFQFLVPGISEK